LRGAIAVNELPPRRPYLVQPRRWPRDERSLIPAVQIERSIHVVRGQRVMMDFDLARLYGVTTKRLNEQVRCNRERFPGDFAFQLTAQELTDLKSQIATSSLDHGGRRYRPWAFTEHGVAMLSSVLRSATAVRVNIEIVRTFVRLRRRLVTPGELVEQLRQLADTVQFHDRQIRDIAQVLQRLMEPPPEPAEPRRFGFRPPVRPPEPPSGS
jgi:ORF6N domain-containing protein